MNFIKKKLKGHKKDDEEEEYEKAVYEQSLHPQNQDQKMKNTEEWQFFQQLSMKVQDTVQKTQTTLNKLKDTRPEDGSNEEDRDFYDVDGELLAKETPPYGTTKVLRAPPRPPPPSGERSSNPIDLDFGSDFSQSSLSKGPPRPPPPGSSDTSFALDSSALHGVPSKSFASPARPPPPNLGKMEPINLSENYTSNTVSFSGLNQTEKDTASFSLLDEFGFKSDPVTATTNTNFQDLLFLDEKEEVDPFDTSFVDVNNITSLPMSLEKKKTHERGPDKSFNPFSSSVASDEWMTNSPNHSDANKKSITNPFFSGIPDDSKPISQENFHSASSHNPFSFNEPASVVNDQDDFFGITIEPSLSKDKVTDDLFQQNDDSPKASAEFEYKSEFVNSAFSINETNKMDSVLDDIMSEDSVISSNAIPRKSITNEVTVWDSDKKDKESSIFKSDNVLNLETTATPDKAIDESLLWGSDSLKADVLQPEKFVPIDEPTETPELEIEDVKASDELDFFGQSEGLTNEAFSNPDPPLEDESHDEILQPEKSNAFSPDFPQPKENGTSVLNSDTFSSTSLKESSHDVISDTSDCFDSKYIETSEIASKEEPRSTFMEDFSKPFEEESKQNSFLFKIKSENQHTNLEFDAFAAKFENAKDSQDSDAFDPFMSKRAPTLKKIQENYKGFDSMDEFDPFRVTNKLDDVPSMMKKELSRDSFEDYDNEVDFSVVIKPKVKDSSEIKLSTMEPPKLLPPPKTPTKAFETPASRFNPFDKDFLDNAEISKVAEKTFETVEAEEEPVPALGEAGVRKADSVETPLSPLFDEDTSQPLEIFPKPYGKEGWEMVLRQPNKKKLTGNRFWKKIFVKLSENSVLQLFNKVDDKLPFQELPLQDSRKYSGMDVNKSGTLDKCTNSPHKSTFLLVIICSVHN